MAADLAKSLAIQSWCFRGYKDHGGVINALKACGVSNLELSGAHYRPAPGGDHASVIETYRREGIAITSFGAFHVTKDEAKTRAGFEFAKAAGNKCLVVSIEEGALRLAERLAGEYGVKAAIHNHGRQDADGPVWRLEKHLAESSPDVGLCFDTGWMIDSGEDPVAVAARFAERIYAVHIKDFVFNRAGKPEDVIVGEGNLDLSAFLKLLADAGFDGAFTLEYEGDVSDPVPATKKCVEAVRGVLRKL